MDSHLNMCDKKSNEEPCCDCHGRVRVPIAFRWQIVFGCPVSQGTAPFLLTVASTFLDGLERIFHPSRICDRVEGC